MDAMAARQENAACGEAPLPHVEREAFSRHDDQWLIEQLQAGDTEAFEVLFKRYAARVSRQAMHLLGNEAEAEEVTQEVFLTLYEKAITFRGDAALATWLYRLTANAALGRLRHRKRHPEVSMDDYLPRFRDDGHHLVRPVVDWSSDLERGVASEELRRRGGEDISLWDEEDGFFYDVLHLPNGEHHALKVRSMVGLIPLFAVETLEPEIVDKLPGFKRRMQWFINNRPEFREHVELRENATGGMRRLLSIVSRDQLPSVLRYMLDEAEFLSPYGIRAVSQYHRAHPYVLAVNGTEHRVDYEPAESSTSLFGGNSNWRGPIWFPVNFLLIESLQKFHYFYGDDLKAPLPTNSSHLLNLWDVAAELSRRLTHIFLRDPHGRRPVYGGTETFQHDPHWRDLILFYEYFHGDNGAGIGASHQTGWTALVAKLLQQSGE